MKKVFFLSLLILHLQHANTQKEEQEPSTIPYEEIPTYPENYHSGSIVSRMIDGLGFRYYWATEGLRTQDLEFKPSTDSRNIRHTTEHILNLSEMLLSVAKQQPVTKTADPSNLSFDQIRTQTLKNLKQASENFLNKTATEVEASKLIFGNNKNQNEVPFWYLLNGPLADALYHTGQLVSFRRTSGNPINPKVNVFSGKLND